jgi:hypothetical protein
VLVHNIVTSRNGGANGEFKVRGDCRLDERSGAASSSEMGAA